MTAEADVLAVFTDLRCHCADDVEGHTPGTDACEVAEVKRVSIRPFKSGPTTPSAAAKGTCPKCDRTGVKVTAPMRTGHHPNHHDGIRLGREVVLAPHKRPERGGGPCEYEGGPAETRFTPPRELAGFLRDYGREYVR